MPRGDKSSYTNKQKRQAQHIEEGYEQRGVPPDEAERRAWATVNKETGGGKKSGWSRQESQPRRLAQRRASGRTRRCQSPRGGAFAFGQEGGGDPQAADRTLSAMSPDARPGQRRSAERDAGVS